MSFDLHFYTKRNREVSDKHIADYLRQNGCVREGEYPQWFYGNEVTGVYFSFEMQLESDDPEEIKLFDSFKDFNNTSLTFTLNFIRPNFFGLEAFPFVEKFMSELDLYALNPQSSGDPDNPRQESADEYYADWSQPNLTVSSDYFDEFGLVHFPIEKSNDYWRYNFHKNELQEKLGDDYFVPSLILVRQAATGSPVTLSTWTQHIPNVFPPADFVAIVRKRKKFFRTVDETGLISRDNFETTFADYLEPLDFKGCKIIHPERAAAAADLFNSVTFDEALEGFMGEQLDTDHITNAQRSLVQKASDGGLARD